MDTFRNYTAHIDSKKRLTLRNARYRYYNVKEYENGCIILEPRELKTPDTISAKTLADMDAAIQNFHAGKSAPAIDLADFHDSNE